MSTTNDHQHRSPNGEQRWQPSKHIDEEPLWMLLTERLAITQRLAILKQEVRERFMEIDTLEGRLEEIEAREIYLSETSE
jgi:hypothetical protein